MSLPAEKTFGQTADVGLIGRDAVVYYTSASGATYTMTTRVRSMILTTSGAHLAITLPPVSDAAGMMFFFYFVTRGGSYDVTITDKGDDTDYLDIVLNAANECCILVSDGVHWFSMDGTVPASI